MLGEVQQPKPEDGSAQREGLVCFGTVGEEQVAESAIASTMT